MEISSLFSNIKMESLASIEKYDFNIFEFEKEFGTDNILPLIGKYLLHNEIFLDFIDTKKIEAFLLKVRISYLKNPYHNVRSN
jgi:hypothetical protein